MSVETEVFLNPSVRLDELKDMIEARYNTKVTARATSTPDYMTFNFLFYGNSRIMSVFSNYMKGGFQGTLLTLGCGDAAKRIMSDIADTFGGFYQASDAVGTWDDRDGKLASNNGLAYRFRRAVITKGINVDDIEALKEEVNRWDKAHS